MPRSGLHKNSTQKNKYLDLTESISCFPKSSDILVNKSESDFPRFSSLFKFIDDKDSSVVNEPVDATDSSFSLYVTLFGLLIFFFCW